MPTYRFLVRSFVITDCTLVENKVAESAEKLHLIDEKGNGMFFSRHNNIIPAEEYLGKEIASVKIRRFPA